MGVDLQANFKNEKQVAAGDGNQRIKNKGIKKYAGVMGVERNSEGGGGKSAIIVR